MIRTPIAAACALFVSASAFAQTTGAHGTPLPFPVAVSTAQTQTAPPKPQTPAPPAAVPKAVVPFATDSKIGFVNMQVVVALSELGKKGAAALKELQDKKAAEVSGKQKQIAEVQKEIQQGQGVLSIAVLNQKSLDGQRLQRELDLLTQNADAEVEAMNQSLLSSFSEKSLPVVEALAKEKGLYLVISENSQLAYVSPAIDLTAEIVKRLDAATKGK
jgi:outer membrane protein